MKKIICLLGIILSLYTIISAQEQMVIASYGVCFSNSQGSISSTFGETLIETFETSSGILTSGFQQSNLTITDIIDIEENSFSFSVYPNPANEFVVIRSNEKLKNQTVIHIYDLEGKLIKQEPLTSSEQHIDISKLFSATYIIKVTTNEKIIKTCKIIKIK